ncbi:hypothetical protein H6F96_07530 [Microcoleus sp. FACHB-53]|nr:hypothetical protein [Microcoleus sp. FACHB-53]
MNFNSLAAKPGIFVIRCCANKIATDGQDAHPTKNLPFTHWQVKCAIQLTDSFQDERSPS